MRVQLTVVQGKPHGKTIPVTGTRFLIGRGAACQLRPNSELVSREHAELIVRDDAVLLRDLGSCNGTQVNGRTLTRLARLRDGDRVQVGPLVFTVSIRGATAAAPGPKTTSDDEIASWLIAAADRPIPDRPAGVYAGDTLVRAAAAEESVASGPAPLKPVPRASSDAAGEILRKMTERRNGGPAGRPR